ALDWFKGGTDGLEPDLDERPAAAFNLTTLAMLAGTELAPDLSGHVVMIEEVAEHLYAVDRLLFHA
ncbi:MAG TPA: LD-carboxypeptidase, partial [Erythrobacter sp.]|nr:LD-carboxypeptidase [Erythrobacter sp.]